MTYIHHNRCNNTTFVASNVFTGNLMPSSWREHIITESGRHDLNASWIFSEIVYWYRPDREGNPKFKDDIWQTSYKHFTKKFGYDSERTRRLLVRLEKLGLIRREFRTIEKCGQQYSNVLFIRLLANIASDGSIISYFSANTSDYSLYNNDSNQNYDNVCPKMNIGDLVLSSFLESNISRNDGTISCNEEENPSLNEISDLRSDEVKKMYLPFYEFHTPSPPIGGEHIGIKNKRENKENRSDLHARAPSIFSFSTLDEERESYSNEQSICLNEISNSACEKNKENLKTENQPGIFSEISEKAKKLFGALASKNLKSKPLDWEEGRGLSQLSDISEEEKDILNKRSGREFSLNFINQLILKLGGKCSKHRFFQREQFMNYMVKALMNEILQAPQANNEDFKFACLPKTEEEQYLNQVHKYLDAIESSTNITPEMRLKKKILGKLEPRLAYEILSGTSLSVSKTGEIDDNDIELMELEVKILRLLRINQLDGKDIPDWIEKILLEEARGIYGESVCSTVVKHTSNLYNYTNSKLSSRGLTLEKLNLDLDKNLPTESDSTNSIWNQVSDRLKKIYGIATYQSWFSRLQIIDAVLEDKGQSLQAMHTNTKIETIKIGTPTSFVRDWINTNYRDNLSLT